MNILVFKIISIIAVFFTGLAGALISLKMSSSKRSEKLLYLGNAFAGGIFLGAGFLHMLPDSIEGFSQWTGQSDFPWALLVCAAGYLLILLTSRVLFSKHNSSPETAQGEQNGKITPYIFTLVLSIHSIIAGIALGTESTVALTSIILIALLAHKGSAAFALGVNLLGSGMSTSSVRRITTFFSLMTPLGILTGTVLTTALAGRSAMVMESVFDALAAGTFIYLAGNHIIEEVFSQEGNKWPAYMVLLCGFGVMAVLAVFL